MDLDEVEIVELELKYCERCGGLWLRLCGSQQVYCLPCARSLGEIRVPKPRRTSNGLKAESGFEHVALLCGEGGNA